MVNYWRDSPKHPWPQFLRLRAAFREAVMNPNDNDPIKKGSDADSPCGPGKSGLPPELREWARQQYTEEEIIAGLDELRQNGGLELREFIAELERIVEQP
jgi:hypothetical protein